MRILSFNKLFGVTEYESMLIDLDENSKFPCISFGKNSYMMNGEIETDFTVVVPNQREKNQQLAYPFSRFPMSIQIGNFSSLGNKCKFRVLRNHQYSRACLNYINSSIHSAAENTVLNPLKGQVLIQNDVWVGAGSVINGGITIGNGAIVAAESVVCKDVEPYSIVGGNPAKHIKYRFPKEIIEKLQVIQWWFWEREKIEEVFSNMDVYLNVENFVDIHYKEALAHKQEVLNFTMDIPQKKKNFIFFLDVAYDYFSFRAVIYGFVDYFNEDEDSQLIIFVEKNLDQELALELINEQLEALDGKCEIFIHFQEEEIEEEAIFNYGQYYITNRSENVVKHSCYADMYGLKKIAGADVPLFRDEMFL